MGSSPHTRGARGRPRVYPISSRIIPAYAGSTHRAAAEYRGQGDHPRIRGEHFPLILAVEPSEISSPHTRGALSRAWPRRRPGGIIPAYAGSTLFSLDAIHQTRDHPRIRGEHGRGPSRELSSRGSSPHTRGALAGRAIPRLVYRIIPAYAGSTEDMICPITFQTDHPRIRGEHRVTDDTHADG